MKGIINEVCLESVRETIIKLLKKKNRQQNELQKETGKGKGTIQYHLRILKERGDIEIEKRTKEKGQPLTIKLSDKLKKIYKSSEDHYIKIMATKKHFLLTDAEYRILSSVEENDEGTYELAKMLGLAPTNLINYLKKFEKHGFITKHSKPVKPSGRKRIYRVTELGKTVLSGNEKIKKVKEIVLVSIPDADRKLEGEK